MPPDFDLTIDARGNLCLSAQHIGVVYHDSSSEVRKIIIPDIDDELDDPAHLQGEDGLVLIRLARKKGTYELNEIYFLNQKINEILQEQPRKSADEIFARAEEINKLLLRG